MFGIFECLQVQDMIYSFQVDDELYSIAMHFIEKFSGQICGLLLYIYATSIIEQDLYIKG